MRNPADAARLAKGAEDRLLYRHAISLYRHAADADDLAAAEGLARRLAERGDVGERRARADAGNKHASERLAMQSRGEEAEWLRRFDPLVRSVRPAAKLLIFNASDRPVDGFQDRRRARQGAGLAGLPRAAGAAWGCPV